MSAEAEKARELNAAFPLAPEAPDQGAHGPKKKGEKEVEKVQRVSLSPSPDSSLERRLPDKAAGERQQTGSASSASDRPPPVRVGSDLGASRPESCPPGQGEFEDGQSSTEVPSVDMDELASRSYWAPATEKIQKVRRYKAVWSSRRSFS